MQPASNVRRYSKLTLRYLKRKQRPMVGAKFVLLPHFGMSGQIRFTVLATQTLKMMLS